MEAIGRAGFWATALRHFGGDVAAYMRMLRTHRAAGQPSTALGCRIHQAGQRRLTDEGRKPLTPHWRYIDHDHHVQAQRSI